MVRRVGSCPRDSRLGRGSSRVPGHSRTRTTVLHTHGPAVYPRLAPPLVAVLSSYSLQREPGATVRSGKDPRDESFPRGDDQTCSTSSSSAGGGASRGPLAIGLRGIPGESRDTGKARPSTSPIDRLMCRHTARIMGPPARSRCPVTVWSSSICGHGGVCAERANRSRLLKVLQCPTPTLSLGARLLSAGRWTRCCSRASVFSP